MSCLWNLLTWPFQLAASLIGLILSAVGRVTAFVLGLVICGGGVLLSPVSYTHLTLPTKA